MTKIKKLFKILGAVARKPYLLNNVVNDNDYWFDYVKTKHDLAKGLAVVELDELFKDFQEELKLFGFLDGSSLPTDISLLTKFAKKIEDCKYFEIGTWRGESVANVACFAKECYTLNLSDEEMKTLKFPRKYIDLHGFFSKNHKNIHHLKGNSKTFDFKGLNKQFDLIFIDGDHHYDFVKNDTEKVIENLIHDKSIIVWHDYAYNPENIRYEVLAAILDACPQEMHGKLYHVGNTMSAVLLHEDYKTHTLENPTTPTHFFEVNLKLKKPEE